VSRAGRQTAAARRAALRVEGVRSQAGRRFASIDRGARSEERTPPTSVGANIDATPVAAVGETP
jgi:hypothetical protein